MEKQCVCYLFLVCICVVTGSGKLHLRLDSMHCLGTEDYGRDDLMIKRKVDGKTLTQIDWHDINVGDYYYFHHLYSNFSRKLEVEVIEYDYFFFDRNDNMGTYTIDRNNIAKQFIEMDPWGRGHYTFSWTDLSGQYDKIKEKYKEMKSKSSKRSSGKPDYINQHSAKHNEIHEKIKSHFDHGHRASNTHKAIVETVHIFKNEKSTARERCDVVDKLKKSTGGWGPLRGIINEIENGNWPTIILYGMISPVDFDIAAVAGTYGVAVQADGCKAGLVFSLGVDVGIGTAGDAAKIAIGMNRNGLDGLDGYVYSFTEPVQLAEKKLPGGVTYSFDWNLFDLFDPNLQEVAYSWSPLPQGYSFGFSHTWTIKKN